jgi:hypothetical protein
MPWIAARLIGVARARPRGTALQTAREHALTCTVTAVRDRFCTHPAHVAPNDFAGIALGLSRRDGRL